MFPCRRKMLGGLFTTVSPAHLEIGLQNRALLQDLLQLRALYTQLPQGLTGSHAHPGLRLVVQGPQQKVLQAVGEASDLCQG